MQNEPLYEHLTGLTDALLEETDDVNLDVTLLGAGEEVEEEEEEMSDSDEQSGDLASDDDSAASESSMDADEEEAARQAMLMRDAIRGKGDAEEKRSKRKKSALDDDFFDFDEMAKFADEGESGGGLLTNTGESDEEDIYNMMYGGQEEEDSEEERGGGSGGGADSSSSSSKNKKKRKRGADGGDDEMDPEERRLEMALQKQRKNLNLDDDDDDDQDEDGEGRGSFGSDDDDDDIGAEDAYFEDFFAEPELKKKKRGGDSDESDDFDDEDDHMDQRDSSDVDMDMDEGDDDDDDGGDENGDEEEDDFDLEDDEDESGLSAHQKEQRARERQIREMEKSMMSESKRDDETMTSTGDLGVSSFEAHQRHLLKKTSKLEDELVAKKRWTTGGEVKAAQRGTNTLLEEDLDFELATKQAPVISADVTKSLEDTIKRRIVDMVFDDPIKKLDKPERGDYRDRMPELDQEKSSKSLAQVYEDDYIQQTQGVKDTEKLSISHRDCIAVFKSICQRMDALANANFTPLKVKEELDVVPLKDAGAIRMEEVTPITTSDATLLAPEELYKTSTKGAAKGDSEWTTEEKRAQRREKKKKDAKAKAEEDFEKRRDLQLHPEKAKKKPSIAEALQTIAKGPNTTISKNTDRTHYTSSFAFQKITDAASAPSSSTPQKKRS